MVPGRLKTLFVASVSGRIAGGYAVLLVLLVALAGVAFQQIAPLENSASRVRQDSERAEAAAALSLQVSDTQGHVARYSVSMTMADQKDAEDSLARLDARIAATAASGDLASLARRYRAGTEATFAAVAARRSGIERMQTAGTEVRTIASAIAQALEQETAGELIRAGLALGLGFQDADAAASRFMASRNPADSNIAASALAAVPAAGDELARLAGDNRRIRRFLAALAKPLTAYREGLQTVIAADEALRRAAAGLEAANGSLLRAGAAERDLAMSSQRGAVESMLQSVGSVRRLLLLASLAAVVVGAALAAVIGRGIAGPIARLTRATQSAGEGRSVA